MKKFFISLVIQFLVAGTICFAQDNKAAFVQAKFQNYASHTLQEKLFVHLDKSFFVTGETLWFKIYYVDGSFHKALDLSKVVYLEVLDDKNTPVLQTKVGLSGGKGNGSLNLPAGLITGNYTVRAYTNWMKNFSPDFFFRQPVVIVNPLRYSEATTTTRSFAIDLQFFPEGGNLVADVKSKIAFRMAGNDDRGIECAGTIVDESNVVVTSFQSLKFGMGNFSFTPSRGKTYKAIARTADGVTVSKLLPAVYEQGFVMSVDGKDATTVTITVTVKMPAADQSGSLSLFVHTRQIRGIVRSAPVINGTAVFRIDKELLADGISQFTLFNGEKPVCERLYFLKPKRKLQIAAVTDKQAYERRTKVNISIQATDQEARPQLSNMSIAVFRTDSLQESGLKGIESYLLLSSDIRGHVESADYYFGKDPDTDEALDNVMLTHGWTRFRWEDILWNNRGPFAHQPEYAGHIITGKVVNPKTGVGESGVLTFLSLPGRKLRLYSDVSDEDGRIRFIARDFFGHNEIIVQPGIHDGNQHQFVIDNPFSEKPETLTSPPLQLKMNMEPPVLTESIGIQVQNIFHEKQGRTFIQPDVDTSSFYGASTVSYDLDDYTRFTTIEEILKEYVPGVLVRKPNGKFRLQMFNKEKNFLSYEPTVLLDGVPVGDVDRFMNIDPMNLKRLDVINDIYFLGAMRADGVISFKSYEANLPGFEPMAGSLILDYEGIQLEREFYAPVYSSAETISTRIPDFRNVLYWSPDIETDSNGKAEATFYTSDQPGKYRVVIQGITPDGKASMGIAEFEVISARPR